MITTLTYFGWYLLASIAGMALLLAAWYGLAKLVGFNEETGRLNRENLNWFQKLCVVLFIILDVFVNVAFITFWMLQLPTLTRLTLTARLRFILLSGEFKETEWRYRIAENLCKRRISKLDYNHCGMKFGKKKY